ncbi:MAG: DUF4962 domain-containing protein [Saprospiraceae bacterium]|nr:DUF4962 domain-containing protein [Saprospiraceae bacterium]
MKVIKFLFSLIFILMGEASVAQYDFSKFTINEERPRIWIDKDKKAWLKQKFERSSTDDVFRATGKSVVGYSLAYVITGNEEIGQKAIDIILGSREEKGSRFYDKDTKEGRSKARSIQAPLADLAICYDYCLDLLTPEEKKAMEEAMLADMKKRIDFRRSWRSFHNSLYASAWPVTAATIALMGEVDFAKKAWDFLLPELEDAMKTFELFPDGEWCEGFDYNRHSTYHMLRILLAIKSASGIDLISSSEHMKNTGKYILYSTKPNGLALPGDDNDWPYIGDWEHVALLMLNEIFKDPYNQYYINNCPFERFKLEDQSRYAAALWYDPNIKERPLSDLPLSRLFKGKGLLIGRSSWEFDHAGKTSQATWFSYHCGDYWGDHVHNDINHIEIYHKGSLALDAGRYDDDWGIEVDQDSSKIRQSQFFNYYRRTIAHNTLLVKDPNEYISQNLINDGGQKNLLRPTGYLSYRNVPEDYEQGNFPSEEGLALYDYINNLGRWETGDVKAFEATNDFIYIAGDGTTAYSQNKLDKYVRKIFFLQPDVFVIFDHVVSTNPDFKKTLLFHSIEEPIIKGNKFEIKHNQGKLTGITVLPKKTDISKVGGEGLECMVDGVSLPFGMNAQHPSALHYGEEAGAWRIEVSPAKAKKEDVFVNVLKVGDRSANAKLKARIISNDKDSLVVKLVHLGSSYTIQYGKNSGAGHIQCQKGNKILWKHQISEGHWLISPKN